MSTTNFGPQYGFSETTFHDFTGNEIILFNALETISEKPPVWTSPTNTLELREVGAGGYILSAQEKTDVQDIFQTLQKFSTQKNIAGFSIPDAVLQPFQFGGKWHIKIHCTEKVDAAKTNTFSYSGIVIDVLSFSRIIGVSESVVQSTRNILDSDEDS